MTKGEKISRISEIILKHGDNLSDGFGYYCQDTDKELASIAQEILIALEEKK